MATTTHYQPIELEAEGSEKLLAGLVFSAVTTSLFFACVVPIVRTLMI